MLRYITIKRFAEISGYTQDAIRAKISRGDWLMGAVWIKAPDGRILIDVQGYERWALGEPQHLPPRPPAERSAQQPRRRRLKPLPDIEMAEALERVRELERTKEERLAWY